MSVPDSPAGFPGKQPRRKRPVKRGLTFNEGSHRYWLDGDPVPGVTTIIGVLDKSNALTKWAAGEVAKYVAENPDAVDALRSLGPDGMVAALKNIPWSQRDTAAARGTKFHWYAQEILLGHDVDVPTEHVGMVNAALDFMDDWAIEPIAIEAAVGSRKHWYAGTADLVATHNRSERSIFDWKSGKKVYSGAVWQLTAYGNAEFAGLNGDETPVADWGIETAYGVHIRDDGYSVHPLKYGKDVFDAWLHIRAAYDAHKAAEGDWKTPGSGYVGAAETRTVEDGVA